MSLSPSPTSPDHSTPRHPWFRRAVVFGAIAGVLAACGGSGATDTTGATPTTSTTGAPDADGGTASSAPRSDRPGDDTGATTPGTEADADSDAGDTSIDEGGVPPQFREGTLALAVEFSSACVLPGSRQTIRVRTTPSAAVAYQAIYADRKTAFDPDYAGGNAGGIADSSGSWSDTWIVGPAAPTGDVHVDVIARTQADRGYERASFAVAGADGTCS